MGACDFKNRVRRLSRGLEETFREEAADARHEYGHGGYTGTIAEKWEVRLVPARHLARAIATWEDAEQEADRLMASEAPEHVRYSDCDAPCWAIEVPGEKGGWLLFGVARS